MEKKEYDFYVLRGTILGFIVGALITILIVMLQRGVIVALLQALE